METIIVNGKKVNSKIWTNIFYSGNALRPSCYECPYKSIYHPGDITIADYWGIENVVPEFDDNNGVSLVLINNDKGMDYFNRIQDSIIFKETNIENSMQRAFISPENRPESREQFWKDFEKRGFSYILKKYGGKASLLELGIKIIKKYIFKK